MATVSLPPPLKSHDHREASPTPASSSRPAAQHPTSPRHYQPPPPTSTNYPTSPYHRPASPKHLSSSSPKRTLSPAHHARAPSGRRSPSYNHSPEHATLLKPVFRYSEPTVLPPPSSTVASSSKSLQCAVCMRNYKDARMLPCFHTFCASCLEVSCLQSQGGGSSKPDTVYCPVCMDTSELSSRGVQGLPRNMYVQHLQELQESPAPSCDLCVSRDPAVKRCERCECDLCRFCLEAHKKQRKTSLHRLVDLVQNGPSSHSFPGLHVEGVAAARGGGMASREVRKVIRCETHEGEEAELYCNDCNVPFCKRCVSSSGTGHTHHNIVPLREAETRYEQLLEGLLTRARPLAASLSEAVRNLEFVTSNVQRRCETVSEEIIEFVSAQMRALQEHKRSLLLQLDAIKERKENTLSIQASELKSVLMELNSSYSAASEALNDGTPSLAFSTPAATGGEGGTSVASRLEELVSTKLDTSPREDDYVHFRAHAPTTMAEAPLGEMGGGVLGTSSWSGVLDSRGPSAAHTLTEGEGLYTARERKVAQFKVRVRDRYKQPRELGGDKVDVHISGPTSESVPAVVSDNEDGSYAVRYTPLSVGEHRVSILVGDKNVRGSPFLVGVVCGARGGPHRGVFHCCTFCSSRGKKHVKCGCGSAMPGGYSGCGHGHPGHPGQKHWSCCGSTVEDSDCLV